MAVILDIEKRVNKAINIFKKSEKSLSFLTIFIVKKRAIIFILLLMVNLIKDKVDKLLILLKLLCF